MARMRPVTERIENPDIESFKRRQCLGGETIHVRRIDETAEAESESGDVAVLVQERQRLDRAALACNRYGFPGGDTMCGHDRRIFAAFGRLETISEAGIQHARSLLIEIDIDALALY